MMLVIFHQFEQLAHHNFHHRKSKGVAMIRKVGRHTISFLGMVR
jgi:hypothetical protein